MVGVELILNFESTTLSEFVVDIEWNIIIEDAKGSQYQTKLKIQHPKHQVLADAKPTPKTSRATLLWDLLGASLAIFYDCFGMKKTD